MDISTRDFEREIDDLIDIWTPDGDHEACHGREEDLMREAIIVYAPPAVVAQFRRLWEGDFTRWYA